MEVHDQVISIYAATKGYFDTVPTNKIGEAETRLLETLRSKHADLINGIATDKVISPENESKLIDAIKDFVATSGY
jgi:F-type H+-transporting ATPase subunit alpha